MKKFISTQHEIQAPATQVWAKIAQGDGVENWLPIIKSSKLEGDNRRVCEMYEGGRLEETILKSDGTQTFMYRIDYQEAFPAQNIVGTMRVEAINGGQSRLFWDVEMEVESEEAFGAIEQNIVQIYQQSAQKLEQVA